MNLLNTILLTTFSAFADIGHAIGSAGAGQMNNPDMMNGSIMQGVMAGSPMIIVCVLFGLLVLIVFVLVVLTLVKYVKSPRG